MATPPAEWRGRWRALPLRTRLAVLTTSLLIAGLGIAGVATVAMLHRYLVSEVDERLTASAVDLAQSALASLSRSRAGLELPSDFYVRYTDAEGQTVDFVQPDTLAASGEPLIPDLSFDSVIADGDEPFSVRSTRGLQTWRVVVYPVSGGQSVTGTVAVALPLRDVEATIAQISRVLMLSGLVIVALGGVAGSMAVQRALRPLRAVEATAHAFAAGDLAQRVPAEPPSTEVGRLAISLNGMLAQIEEAFAVRSASEARMRRFVADASHELRTPLSTVRGYGELYRMGAISPDDVGPAMRRIEDEAVRMSALVNDLLHLAKLDEGRPLASEPVDVRVLAADAAADLRALDPRRAVRIEDLGPPGAQLVVQGDENRLRQVVANLIGNVAQHTPAGSPVEIAVGLAARAANPTRAGVVLEVRDHGPGIPPEDADRVFERFYRPDSSRARTSGGSGLGLAIVAGIVAAHSGTVRVVETPGGGTTVRLVLPGGDVAAPDEDGAAPS